MALSDFMQKANDWMTPQRALAFQAIGQGLSQMSVGQPANLSPAYSALMDRQRSAQMQQALKASGVLERFTPEQRAILAQMEPGAAQKIIAQTLFAPEPEPKRYNVGGSLVDASGNVIYAPPDDPMKPIEINGQLVDPITREVLGDYRTQEPPEPIERAIMVDPSDTETLQRLGINPNAVAGSDPFEVKVEEAPDGTVTLKDFSIPGGRSNIPGYTAGIEAVDKAYAPQYLEWIGGKGADAASQAAQISTVLEKLERGEQLTGPIVGVQGDFIRAITNPEAQDAKDRVESVVQRSLRETLGAQFTEKEGERLIARSYNVNLGPEQNAARLRALYQMLETVATAKQAQAAYFQENGTLMGYKPVPLPTIDDMIAAMEAAAPTPDAGSSGGDGWQEIDGVRIRRRD